MAVVLFLGNKDLDKAPWKEIRNTLRLVEGKA